MRVSAVVVEMHNITSFFLDRGDLKMEDIDYDSPVPEGNYISIENNGKVNFINKIKINYKDKELNLLDIPSEKIKEILKSRTRNLIFNR